jgi:hypothetical protein
MSFGAWFLSHCQARPKFSSFYLTSRLLSLFLKDEPLASQLKIHIYDRLWAPHVLVRYMRYGVAPDHPAVKVRFLWFPPRLSFKRVCHFMPNCTHKLDQAAADPRLRFFGNVQVGLQTPPPILHALPISLSALKPHYRHLLSTGCTTFPHQFSTAYTDPPFATYPSSERVACSKRLSRRGNCAS